MEAKDHGPDGACPVDPTAAVFSWKQRAEAAELQLRDAEKEMDRLRSLSEGDPALVHALTEERDAANRLNDALVLAMREALMRPENWREAINTALNDLDKKAIEYKCDKCGFRGTDVTKSVAFLHLRADYNPPGKAMCSFTAEPVADKRVASSTNDGPGHKCDVCGLLKQDTFETCRDCYMSE